MGEGRLACLSHATVSVCARGGVGLLLLCVAVCGGGGAQPGAVHIRLEVAVERVLCG